jgi:DNA-binding response OmpR family regulator
MDEALELPQRIDAATRTEQESMICVGVTDAAAVVERRGVRIDRIRHRAFLHGRELPLTVTEFRLLDCLVRHAGEALTRDRLSAAAVRDRENYYLRAIDRHMTELRRKLRKPQLIETVWRIGYRFRGSDAEEPHPGLA